METVLTTSYNMPVAAKAVDHDHRRQHQYGITKF